MLLFVLLLPLLQLAHTHEGLGAEDDCPFLGSMPEEMKQPTVRVVDTLHDLDDSNFESSIKVSRSKRSHDSWFVLLHSDDCDLDCEELWALMADEMTGTYKCATLNLKSNPLTATQYASVTKGKSKTVLLFHMGLLYRHSGAHTFDDVIDFALTGFTTSEHGPIPVPPPPPTLSPSQRAEL